MNRAHPVLYSFRRCPYAMRARMALDAAQITVEHREILLKDKPEEMLAASPKGTVPVVVLDDGQVIDESLEVMYWALRQNDPENWLTETQNADTLIACNDGDFKHHLDRYKYATRYEGAVSEVHRSEAAKFISALEMRLSEKPYLSGPSEGLADIAIFPFIRQFANTDREWFNAQPWANTRRWLDRHLSSDRFKRIMQKHDLFVSESAQG